MQQVAEDLRQLGYQLSRQDAREGHTTREDVIDDELFGFQKLWGDRACVGKEERRVRAPEVSNGGLGELQYNRKAPGAYETMRAPVSGADVLISTDISLRISEKDRLRLRVLRKL